MAGFLALLKKARPTSAWAVTRVTFLFTLVMILLSILTPQTPNPQPASAPLEEFSAARAMEQLRMIAKEPHPMGSAAHDEVLRYIQAEFTRLGLTPSVQRTTAVNEQWGKPYRAGTVQNLLARLPGSRSTKAVLLLGHYDSVSTSPGASDDGHSVVVILETLRALRAGPPLKNDIVFLLTDGEESGLLGAKAFVDEHPWAKDVGLVLNFEARGTSGPGHMFETSPQNGWLIREFAKAAPYPIANSLSAAIYEFMPNDTDLTIFKKAGYQGMNFAYIHGLSHYHTALDTIDRISLRSLQHQGSYALALTRHFGNLALDNSRQADAIFFNPIGNLLFQYPRDQAAFLALIVTTLYVGLLVFGFRKKLLKPRGVMLGILAFLAQIAVAAVLAALAVKLLTAAQGRVRVMYASQYYVVCIVTLTIAVFTAIYNWLRRRLSVYSLAAGALGLWWALMIVSCIYLPGGSYLFTWPLLSSLTGLGILLNLRERFTISGGHLAAILLCSVPGLLLLPPLIYSFFLAMTLSFAGVLAVLVVLLLGLIIPHFNTMSRPNPLWLTTLSGLVTFVFLLAGASMGDFDAEHPKPNSILYGMNVDKGQAFWASVDGAPDSWTSQFLTATPEKGTLGEVIPLMSADFLTKPAPLLPIPAPAVEVLDDQVNGGWRTARLRISSGRRAPVMTVSTLSDVEIEQAAVNGRPVPAAPGSEDMKAGQKRLRLPDAAPRGWSMIFHNPPEEGIELILRTKPTQPLQLRIADQSYGLPGLAGLAIRPRPVSMMPLPHWPDATWVARSFVLEPRR